MEERKDQESSQSSTTPHLGLHMGKLRKTTARKHHTLVSQDACPFQAGDDKAATNRRESMTDTKHR